MLSRDPSRADENTEYPSAAIPSTRNVIINAVALLTLTLALGLLATAATAYGYSYVREIIFPQPVDGYVHIRVDSGLLGSFRGLYMSSTSDCGTPLPTMYYVSGLFVNIVFEADGGKQYYLCYGDVTGPRLEPTLLGSGALSVEFHSTKSSDSGSAGWERLDTGAGYTYSYGGMAHVEWFNLTIYVNARSATVTAYCDGTEIGSTTVTGYGYRTVYVRNVDCTSLNFRSDNTVNAVDYSTTYYPYIYNESSTTVGKASWLRIRVTGKSYRVAAGNATRTVVEIVSGVANHTLVGDPVGITVDDEKMLVEGPSGAASFPADARPYSNATLTVFGTGWTGEETIEYAVYGLNVTYVEAVVGPATQAAGSTNGGQGNSTLQVVVSGGAETAYAISLAVAAIAVTAMYYFASRDEVLPGGASGFAAMVAAAELVKAGDYETAYLVALAALMGVIYLIIRWSLGRAVRYL